jgi:hypothetical protein
MSNKPERLSHEWHARELDKAIEHYATRARDARSKGGVSGFCTAETERYLDLAAKLRQAAKDAELLEGVQNILELDEYDENKADMLYELLGTGGPR